MIAILGGGLAGLAAAWRLGEEPHVVLEAGEAPGGLCRSRTVDGFTFDYTGHLLHVRDPRVVGLIDELWPDTFEIIARRAVIRSRGATLPFPYQANLHGLPREQVAECILGLVEALNGPVPTDPATSFRDWSLAVFGRGISDGFMFPYNTKLFGRAPDDMTADWVSWAVPRPTLPEVVRGALGIANTGMGYNPTFRYPRRGGIEVVPRAFAERVRTVRCSARVAAIDLDRRTWTLDDGETERWDRLVVTTPLPAFLEMCRGGGRSWAELGRRLDWSVVGCVILGVDRSTIAGGAHWVYFPDADVPFYRAGFPSNFSGGVAPEGTSSMYVEFGLPRNGAVDRERLIAAAVDGLTREGFLDPGDRVLAADVLRIDPGYVIFDRARQEILAEAEPALRALGVDLIGRYGAWTYSYMERAILDGLETAERLLGTDARRK